MTKVLYTIGHSNHPIESFIEIISSLNITAVADVRSHPYSRYYPQYSQEPFKNSLRKHGIAYAFLGKELGARSEDPSCYSHGKVRYELIAKTSFFQSGLDRIKDGINRYNIALMCAEKDPLVCHRALLVSRHLNDENIKVYHIHANGSLEEHSELESRLLKSCKLPEGDLFTTRDEYVNEAYRIQGARVAYQDESLLEDESKNQ